MKGFGRGQGGLLASGCSQSKTFVSHGGSDAPRYKQKRIHFYPHGMLTDCVKLVGLSSPCSLEFMEPSALYAMGNKSYSFLLIKL